MNSDLLDAAKAAKEVAMFTALTLMRTGGDGAAALVLLDEVAAIDGVAAVGDELDGTALSAQAIREAMSLRGSVDGPEER